MMAFSGLFFCLGSQPGGKAFFSTKLIVSQIRPSYESHGKKTQQFRSYYLTGTPSLLNFDVSRNPSNVSRNPSNNLFHVLRNPSNIKRTAQNPQNDPLQLEERRPNEQ